eukprot:TRINITY_DN2831_c0_g1_i2.p1 TRINITY_DN2831_c0_g1~~TRINITY_DN2831_c0_g1_i2.p1  ORF type:complete len:547 (+),score=151.59 TRINITY_DN2831_c0_g1_i2:1379-3019(+)
MEKKYFTWDSTNFPTPQKMQEKLAMKGRKLVTIVDPHIKRDTNYFVHSQAQNKDLYVKTASRNVYEGHCWPGSVSYLDFFVAEVRSFWSTLFGFGQYEHSTPSLFIWNDMNEPSVFNGPEVTMPKDCLHAFGTLEHRDVHNQYGFYVQQSTYNGLLTRSSQQERPFVLTRSFFAGSQRYGAVWTGDNTAKWEHLEASIPMLLSLGVAGIQFAGADVGGFFGNPDTELLIRWYQMGAFSPFFRAHSHIDTKRREPWLSGEPTTSYIREVIRLRYSLLPYIYTVFKHASVTGLPILRAAWVEFPEDEQTFASEDQFMFGPSLLVHPVVHSAQRAVSVYLPGNVPWYELKTGQMYAGHQTLSNYAAPLEHIPVFLRGGRIIARKERARRSSQLMSTDPFTLQIALDQQGSASGDVYVDDGHSFAFLAGAFVWRQFVVTSAPSELVLTASAFRGFASSASSSTALATLSTAITGASSASSTGTIISQIERVILFGLNARVTQVELLVGQERRAIEFEQSLPSSSSPAVLVLRKPNVPISADFIIKFSLAP